MICVLLCQLRCPNTARPTQSFAAPAGGSWTSSLRRVISFTRGDKAALITTQPTLRTLDLSGFRVANVLSLGDSEIRKAVSAFLYTLHTAWQAWERDGVGVLANDG